MLVPAWRRAPVSTLDRSRCRTPIIDHVHYPRTVYETEVSDVVGRVIVETRLISYLTWETTIMPGDDPAPDGPEAAICATVHKADEALAAHDRAVAFATVALRGTGR